MAKDCVDEYHGFWASLCKNVLAGQRDGNHADKIIYNQWFSDSEDSTGLSYHMFLCRLAYAMVYLPGEQISYAVGFHKIKNKNQEYIHLFMIL